MALRLVPLVAVLLLVQVVGATIEPDHAFSTAEPAAAQAGGEGGCAEELVLDVAGADASVLARVVVPSGHKIFVDLEHTIVGRRNADDWRIELRMSEASPNGFPAAPIGEKPQVTVLSRWGDGNDPQYNTISWTNNGTDSDLVLELAYQYHRVAPWQNARTIASNFRLQDDRGRAQGPACVRVGGVPERPASGCVGRPVIALTDRGEVRSEPFSLARGEKIQPYLLSEVMIPPRTDGAFGGHRGGWSVEIALVRSGRPVDWSDRTVQPIDDKTIENGWWSRDAYLEPGPILTNTVSAAFSLELVMRVVTTDRDLIDGDPLAFTTIDSALVDGESQCIGSSETTVDWSLRPHCAADDTSALRVSVTNKDATDRSYRIVLTNPTTGLPVHESHNQRVSAGSSGDVTLGGVPDGTVLATVYDGDRALLPPRVYTVSRFQACIAKSDEPIVWAAEATCASDGTRQLVVTVRNQSLSRRAYRIEVREPGDDNWRHRSQNYWIDPGAHRDIRLGGIPWGELDVVIMEAGRQIGAPLTYFFSRYDCGSRPACPTGPTSYPTELDELYCAFNPDVAMTIDRIEYANSVLRDFVGRTIVDTSNIGSLSSSDELGDLVHDLNGPQAAAVQQAAAVIGLGRLDRFLQQAEVELLVESVSMYEYWEHLVPIALLHGDAQLQRRPEAVPWDPDTPTIVSLTFDVFEAGNGVRNAFVYRGATPKNARMVTGLLGRASFVASGYGVVGSIVSGDTESRSFQYSLGGLGFGAAGIAISGPPGWILGAIGTTFGIFSLVPECPHPGLHESVNRHITYRLGVCFDTRSSTPVWQESVKRTEQRLVDRMIAAGCVRLDPFNNTDWYEPVGAQCTSGFDDRSSSNLQQWEWWFCETDRVSEWTYAIGVGWNRQQNTWHVLHQNMQVVLDQRGIRSVQLDQNDPPHNTYSAGNVTSHIPSCP